ncbi:STAS domain-containing protein [Actinomadura rupiterrae]|uniref:STAS domain-containing protein n=1 Tax=Actinomadura rupiterrae TaxID=559627 RepID=UPI0020A4739B|nr:STAS domain-containing protein [Actinomadura rupiterrae]MCP2341684.1 anti-sigma B factor antagonist [Actinomadura rupiterrae]
MAEQTQDTHGPGLRIHVTGREGEARRIAVCGDLDIATAETLRAVFAGASGESVSRIVVDLSGVSFCDSSGLSALVDAEAAARAAGIRFTLARPHHRMAELLRITCLDRHFHIAAEVPTGSARH